MKDERNFGNLPLCASEAPRHTSPGLILYHNETQSRQLILDDAQGLYELIQKPFVGQEKL